MEHLSVLADEMKNAANKQAANREAELYRDVKAEVDALETLGDSEIVIESEVVTTADVQDALVML